MIDCASQHNIVKARGSTEIDLRWKFFASLRLHRKNIDGKWKSRFDGEHENKDLRINSRILLFGMGNVFRRQSADGQVEPERGEIENHTGNYEKHPCGLLEHVWASEDHVRRNRPKR